MTSRERLLAVLNGKMPDRVPISTYELNGYGSWKFENREESYRPLMDLIRRDTDCMLMWGLPGNEVAAATSHPVETETFKYDEGEYHVTKRIFHAPGRDLTSISKINDTVVTNWGVERLCKDTEDVDALMAIPFEPVQYTPGKYQALMEELGEHGIIMASLPDATAYVMEMMEFGEATVWAMTEEEHFSRTIEEIHRRLMINLKNNLDTQPLDFYRIYGPEYMTPPYMPPAFFEKYVYPHLCDMVDLIHQYGKKVRIHSHGKIGRVLDMILDTGADGLDPCEPIPDGDISLADIKKKAKGRAVVFGNLELKMLENASEEEVRQAVRQCMDEAKEGGGFVIMPTAAPINIPLAAQTERNFRIYIEEALKLGKY